MIRHSPSGKIILFALLFILLIQVTGCMSESVVDVCFRLENYEKALKTVDKMLKKHPDNPDALYQKALALIYLDRAEEALPILDKVLATETKSNDALNNKSMALYTLERYDEAYDYSVRSLEIEPNTDMEYLNHGNVLLAFDRNEEALGAYLKALELDSANQNALYGLASAYYSLADYHEARLRFSEYLALVPEDTDAILYLGYSSLYSGDTEKALEYAEKLKAMAITLTGSESDALYQAFVLTAECHVALEQYDIAKTTLEAAEKLQDHEPILYRLLGEVHYSMDNYSKSIRAYERMAELEPDLAYPYIQNVYNYLACEDTQTAIAQAEIAIALEPGNEEAINAIGNIYGWETQYRLAYDYFQQAVTVNPDYVTGHVNSLWALYNSGLYRKCVEYGETVALRFPEEADIYGYLGDSWSMLYDIDKTVLYYQKAYGNDVNSIYYIYRIALEYYIDQQYDKAQEYLDKAMKLEPENDMCLTLQKELEKRERPLSWQVVDFVASNYLYFSEVEGIAAKLEAFKKQQNANGNDVTKFIESILQSEDLFTFCLTGEEYDLYQEMEEGNTVSCRILPLDSGENVHYFDIEYFGMKTANQFIEAAEEIPDKDSSVLVIDLRDNGGGYMDSCMELLDYLLGSCVVGSLTYRDGNISPYYSDQDAIGFKKIFILTNQNSASCSEMLALALKKYLNSVTILGEPTFGKGVGQISFESEKDKIAILLVNFYWNVKEVNVMKNGIQPDVVVSGKLEEYLHVIADLLQSG